MICSDCPRKCGALRENDTKGGICRSPLMPVIARAAPHFGEEPCISGTRGSGTVFFSGCNLRCCFCQNHDISRGGIGKTVSVERLRDIFLELQDKGVHNISLVTASHFARAAVEALDMAQLKIPVVWNSSGYDSVEALKMLEGRVQIFMPDMKYIYPEPARLYSGAPDYPEVARSAIAEMYRQVGDFVLDDEGIMQKGVLIRHLILPENEENTRGVIDYVADTYPGKRVLFSLMSQFTPMADAERFPELCHRVGRIMNARLCDYMTERGIEYGYTQEVDSSGGEMIPDFDLSGV